MSARILGMRARVLTPLWLVVVLSLYTGAAVLGGRMLLAEKAEAAQRHAARLDPDGVEEGRTAPVVPPPDPDAPPSVVRSGIYLDRVTGLSITGTSWEADFYIWFVWSGEEPDPGKRFQIAGGEVRERVRVELREEPDGPSYSLYRVFARITKSFNTTRYPLDQHLLTIHIEDFAHPITRLVFEPDTAATTVSSRVEIPGFLTGAHKIISKPHSYKTDMGDPRTEASRMDTHSQLVFGLNIERPGWGVFFKMFQALFAAVLVALLALAVLPSNNPRFGLGVGAFFASIATTYVTNRQLPDAGILTMTDIINGVGMGTIFLTLIHSAIALHMLHRDYSPAAIRRFDDLGLLAFGVGYVATNVTLALCAA